MINYHTTVEDFLGNSNLWVYWAIAYFDYVLVRTDIVEANNNEGGGMYEYQ